MVSGFGWHQCGGGDVLVVASILFYLTVMDCGGACGEEMMACSPVASGGAND